MCGIAGVYRLPDAEKRVPEMLAAIAHRGPDAVGSYRADAPEGTHLGTRRLSIIDPSSAADQPFIDDGLCLVYNGEIYNFRELRRDLESEGATFRTSSDTEVLIKAWRHWGPSCLERLRGMFAFAIFDEESRSLFLARDPFGIKPLFLAEYKGGLAFASEIKALLPVLPDASIDLDGVVASLMYYWIPENYSVYRGVTKLPPGHWARATPNGTIRLSRYWNPRDLVTTVGPEPGTEELRGVIEDSVRAHMVSDVPVASFLSGGLDSSLVTAIAAEVDPGIEAYTISFREQDQAFEAMPDDVIYARRFAQRYGITLHEIEIAPDVAEMLPRMVDILDEPIGDPAAINTFLICEASRRAGVKVMLSGMGADELFGGYRKHYAALLAARYRRLPRLVRKGVIEPIVDRVPVAGKRRGYRYARWAKRFTGFAGLDEVAAFQRSYSLYSDADLKGLVAPDLHDVIDRLLEEHRSVYWEGPSDDQVNRMCYTDMRLFLPSLNLAYTDRASMAASTEVRVPYVDTEVARAAFAIPGSRKIVGRSGKAPLKQAATTRVPEEIINRPKGLFSAPLRAWVRRDLKDMVDDVLIGGELIGSGVLDRRLVTEMVQRDRDGIEDHSKEIWHLLTLETWYQRALHRPAVQAADQNPGSPELTDGQ